MMLSRRKFLRDISRCALWLPVAPAIVRAQAVLPYRRRKGGNHLLNGLISYWKYIDTTDSQDGNTLTLTGGVFGPASIFGNNYFGYGINGASSINPCPVAMRLGAGKSFSISTWQLVGAGGFSSSADSILGQYSNAAATISYYLLGQSTTGKFRFVTNDTALNAVGMDVGLAVNNAWNHVVVGYDSSTKTMFGQLNGGARQTQVIANDVNSSSFQYTTGELTALTQFQGGICETAWYSRALTTTDVGNLYNGAAGLPLSAFTN